MQKISTLILSDEFSTEQVLKLFISEFDNLELLESTKNYSEIFEILSNNPNKTIFIVDLSVNKQEKLDLILKVTSRCTNCKILALADNPSVDLIIQIMRAGAREFIPVPIIKNEFFDAVNKTIAQFEQTKKVNKCKIISVFSNKGGIGKTSLATNLALELSKITKENVALLDMNFQMGDVFLFTCPS